MADDVVGRERREDPPHDRRNMVFLHGVQELDGLGVGVLDNGHSDQVRLEGADFLFEIIEIVIGFCADSEVRECEFPKLKMFDADFVQTLRGRFVKGRVK